MFFCIMQDGPASDEVISYFVCLLLIRYTFQKLIYFYFNAFSSKYSIQVFLSLFYRYYRCNSRLLVCRIFSCNFSIKIFMFYLLVFFYFLLCFVVLLFYQQNPSSHQKIPLNIFRKNLFLETEIYLNQIFF